ncbi:prepilin-type N-terminal cleavage/methylation domain-containing protein [Neisseria dumasiana]|nr:prepilin-type N-terminal cleavage/methylation domain-containing protein [Neisseria dumasiana]
MHTQRGFTLTELLFTIAILAVLAAIAIPVYQKYIKNGAEVD